jgi:hypothetical protein
MIIVQYLILDSKILTLPGFLGHWISVTALFLSIFYNSVSLRKKVSLTF